MKRVLKLLTAFLCFYVCLGILLFLIQDNIVYHPQHIKTITLDKTMPKLKTVTYYLPSGVRLHALYKPPRKGMKTVLYFHGNSQYAEYHAVRLKFLYNTNYGLLIPEYIGYGGIKGEPSQKSMEEVALTAVKYLNSTGTPNNKIVVYGHSIGTYPAVYVATQSEKEFNGIILEAPFLSAEQVGRDMVKGLYPVSVLLKNKYPSDTIIQNIKTRLLVAHGKKDKVIPYYHGWELYKLANQPKVFFSSDTAHHMNLLSSGFDTAVLDWIKEKK